MTAETSKFFSQDERGVWWGITYDNAIHESFTEVNLPHNRQTAVKATAEEARHCAVAMLVEPGGETSWGYRWHSLPIIAKIGKVER